MKLPFVDFAALTHQQPSHELGDQLLLILRASLLAVRRRSFRSRCAVRPIEWLHSPGDATRRGFVTGRSHAALARVLVSRRSAVLRRPSCILLSDDITDARFCVLAPVRRLRHPMTTEPQQFKGKTVLVTASSKGIGLAIVRKFALQGGHPNDDAIGLRSLRLSRRQRRDQLSRCQERCPGSS